MKNLASIFRSPKRNTDNEAPTEEALAETWTYGRTLKTKALLGGVVVVALAWPVTTSLGAVMVHESSANDAAVVDVEPVSAAQQSLGAIAQEFVAAWLAADRDHPELLERFIQDTTLALPGTGLETRNLATLSVQEVSEEITVVTVSAEVRNGEQWDTRTFEIPLGTTGSEVSILGLPQQVAAEAVKPGSIKTYSQDVSTEHGVTDTVSGFLNAYLAGTGDITRFVSPGVEITPVGESQVTAVKLSLVEASTEVPEAAADGTRLHVSTRVELRTEDSFLPADYQLTLTARAGRWEVSHLGLQESLFTAPETSD